MIRRVPPSVDQVIAPWSELLGPPPSRRSWTFEIPLCGHVLISPNDRHAHWQEKARLTADLKGHVHRLAKSERVRLRAPVAVAPRSVRIVILRGPGQREMDDDNATGACKAARDALCAAGWLAGDSRRWLSGYRVTQRMGASAPGLEITVTEAGG